MILHYAGKYNLDPGSLPSKPHQPGAVPFKEPKDAKELSKIANGIAILLLVLLGIILYLRCGNTIFKDVLLGSVLSLVCLFPHELLHAVCFKEDVYVYTNLKQGMAFVVGPETMSKTRFIFMSLLPNLIFGIIPYYIALMFPSLSFLGVFGALSISMGAGDYFNIYNAATQMPGKSRTYLYQFNSFWYMPN
jgi:Protein of unknown function (DUF3267).